MHPVADNGGTREPTVPYAQGTRRLPQAGNWGREPRSRRKEGVLLSPRETATTRARPADIANGDFLFDTPSDSGYIWSVMIAHYEPVEGWGLEPCGNLVFPTHSRGLEGTEAARRTRQAPGAAYSRSNVAVQHLCFYRRRRSCRRMQRTTDDGQTKSSPAAAPPVQSRPAFQADRRDWTGNRLRCSSLALAVRPRMSGDLENSRREGRYERNEKTTA